MSQAYIGQIQPYGFGFAPKYWAQCNGQILSIAQYTALFALLGTTYGGNGQTTFALPDLQSRVPMHYGQLNGVTYSLGEESGVENLTLNFAEMPFHNHGFLGTSAAANSFDVSAGTALAAVTKNTPPAGNYYGPDTIPMPINIASIGPAGGNQPHNNLQPYLTINWCICMTGIFPARN